MGPEDLLLLVLMTALTIYALFGGADFGAGVWEFTSAGQSTEKERRHIYKAIGPVWEANHVWLIFVLVILMNGFPLAFAALSRALWVPLLLAMVGIVFRGASYAFRYYSRGSRTELKTWEALFAIASTATPFFLGASGGAIASGTLPIDANGAFRGDFLTGWMTPLAIFTGFYEVGLCAYLAAIFLAREAAAIDDPELAPLWRRRALSTGLWMGLLSASGLVVVWLEAPGLHAGFMSRGWPLVALSLLGGIGSLVELGRSNYLRASLAAATAVTAVVWGWGVAQYPLLVPPSIDKDMAKAPDNVLWMMLLVSTIGAGLLLPSLAYLFILFKSSQALEEVESTTRLKGGGESASHSTA
ncbi:MAG: cytochrome D ubiquinol oxidase subunit II [Pirellulaceae bacterium]|nr:MAG: cytochrome D ubiquinol oxidase subunit II [Pirellulaceae bacterium]